MWHELVTPKFLIVYLVVASALFIHFRGRERLRFARQLTDHSTFTAPYNALMYLFTAVPTTPIRSVRNDTDGSRLINRFVTRYGQLMERFKAASRPR